MLNKNRLAILLISLLVLVGCQTSGGSRISGSAAEIDRDVDYALQDLYASNPAAKMLARKAKGILVFPTIVKAGFMVGAQYGRGGALRVRGRTAGYYNSVAASYGLQAGVQSFGYALFFMNAAALDYLNRSEGWEIGVGPSIVVVDAGVAKTLTTTTAKDNVYAFIFGQKGLMAGLGLQGSKITRIYPE
ncbi:lipid-binding SYLF domain-containing protein [Methylomicrobium sp. Wu6]|uniref:lipid-binding SYLF domain-containing protein n=1 Tax=Methylomicrobium sp. Wu6 TaxID=3107928 RepID=UPI002DD6657A|nr:lipid-binding SYLF domain-containing protein [Methylomicrobium sp. Wu6]MEC4749151.1 lipid-binding SYLF domain-containing protein [Methylomicrobium sp. Wu6]